MDIADRMSQSTHPFYEKFRRAQAGLPPLAPKPKPVATTPKQEPLRDVGIGPKWGDYRTPQVKRANRSGRDNMSHRRPGMSRIDMIRANWKPTPRYPTYDAYLAEKKRRNDANAQQRDPQFRAAREHDEITRAMNGTHTHVWDTTSPAHTDWGNNW